MCSAVIASVNHRYFVSDHSKSISHMLLILLILSPISKEFSIHLAKVVGLGNAGDSKEQQ
jgi:hypothetical protein